MDAKIKHYDLIVIGAGMVGATLACLLAQKGKKVAIVENYLPDNFVADSPPELRVSAISRASQNTFIKIGAWSKMQAMRISPYEAMHVWDGSAEAQRDDDIHENMAEAGVQGQIHFNAADLGEPDLGHIIENKVIQLALLDILQHEPTVDLLCPASLVDFQVIDELVLVTLDNGHQLSASLLAGADGAHSKVRTLAGIQINQNDYGQQGLVATVQPELPHQSTAWQRFMPSGPLALLPLSDGSCSIVWTLPADKADYYLAMDDETFNKELGKASGYRLGELKVFGKRAAFPLVGRHAKHYIKPHIALIGDAVHTIHPLAGQGVNLGIKDAVALASIIAESSRSPGSHLLLRRYERARKADNLLTQKAMEAFKILFGHQLSVVKAARNIGLNLVDKMDPVKHQIIRSAMGISG